MVNRDVVYSLKKRGLFASLFVAAVVFAACAPVEQTEGASEQVFPTTTEVETTPTEDEATTDSAAPVGSTIEDAPTSQDSTTADAPETTTTTTALPDLSDTPVIAALSESGRTPAYGGGNPSVSVAEALSVTMPTVSGEEIDVSQFLGQDFVLWFWAPWCSWCNAEAPRVRTLAQEFGDEVEVVGIAGVSDQASMANFVDRHELHDITHIADFEGRFWFNLDVTYQPWWMFVNDNGEVVLNWQGRLSEDEIRGVMTELAAS